MTRIRTSFLHTVPADALGLAGLIFFGKCSRKLLLLHYTAEAGTVMGIMSVWLVVCVCVLRKQNRV